MTTNGPYTATSSNGLTFIDNEAAQLQALAYALHALSEVLDNAHATVADALDRDNQ